MDGFVTALHTVAVLQAYAADTSIVIPSAAQIAAAQAYIDDPSRRPVTARAFVTASERKPVDIVIADLAPDTVDLRQAIEVEIASVFLDRARPGTPSGSFTLSASWLNEAISRATGEDSHRLLAPADLTFTAGQIPVLGTIRYQ